ncbi:MAG: DUF4258 domain-containing protein [Chloroflexi bacterium]|nr:DUF4258 domain-containing protein [Chloroflexota bacterium]
MDGGTISTPVYTKHARKRMIERSISESDVEAVLEKPHMTYGDGKGNRNFVRTVKGRRIRVVVKGDPPGDPPIIITAMDQ